MRADEAKARDQRGAVASPDNAGGEADDATKEKEADDARNRRKPYVIGGAIVILLLLAGGGVFYWLSTRDLESTDDAFIDGRAVTIAPRISGSVISLDVADNQFVKKDQPLIHIDPRKYAYDVELAEGALAVAQSQLAGQSYGVEIARKNFPAQLGQAQAQLASAKSNLARAQQDYDRQRRLSKQATTQQEVDAATAALKSAQAQVAAAEAQVTQAQPVPQRIGETETQLKSTRGQLEQAQARLDQAKLDLSWAVLRAPQDGWVTRRNVEVGSYVTPGQQIMSLVSPEVWVTANFKENQLSRMRKGQKVKIVVDAFPFLDLRGHVDSFQLGSGAKFTAFPPENATGNYVKVVQRVPVKIVIDSGLDPAIPLPLGISVAPTVTLR